MEIKDLKDLEVLQNALSNYVKETEVLLQGMKEMPPVFVDGIREHVDRAKVMLENTKQEFNNTLNQKIKDKIENGEVIEIKPGDIN